MQVLFCTNCLQSITFCNKVNKKARAVPVPLEGDRCGSELEQSLGRKAVLTVFAFFVANDQIVIALELFQVFKSMADASFALEVTIFKVPHIQCSGAFPVSVR